MEEMNIIIKQFKNQEHENYRNFKNGSRRITVR